MKTLTAIFWIEDQKPNSAASVSVKVVDLSGSVSVGHYVAIKGKCFKVTGVIHRETHSRVDGWPQKEDCPIWLMADQVDPLELGSQLLNEML